ncbi:MAG: VWA domain-containing protein [bacterium]|nr:VWA domain-containing protein [bacterium]
MIYFSFPNALFLLIVAPLFLLGAWMWQCRVARRMKRFSRHALPYPKYARAQLVLVALGLLLGIVAFARPHWGKVDHPTQTYTIRNRNILIAVDISRSMLAQDIQPNRLDYVKADILEFIDKIGTDRVGLIAFKGEAEVLCPLTADKAYVKENIAKLDTSFLPPGETNLAKPIQLAMTVFEVAQTKHNLLLLISDGEALSGEALAAASKAAEMKLPIFTIGVGNPTGSVLTIDGAVVRWDGDVVRTALDETMLKDIANRSNGRYLPLATSSVSKSSLETLYLHYLSQLESDEKVEGVDLVYKDRTWIFLVASVTCFLFAAMLSLGRVSLGRRKHLLAVCIMVFASALFAATPAREAQAAYEKGDYARAIEQYTEALQEDDLDADERALYAYNKAIALWKSGALGEALTALDEPLQHPQYQARAAAWRAHIMYEGLEAQKQAATTEETLPLQQQLQAQLEVIDAYTQALQLDPNNEIAKKNLARMTARLPDLKKAVRKDEVTKRFEKDNLSALTQTLLKKQRELIETTPQQGEGESPTAFIEEAKAFANEVQAQADGWFYLAECANEKLDALLAPPTEGLSEEDLQQRQQVRQVILEEATKTYQALDDLAATYRALETSPEPLLPSEETAYRMFQSFADVGGLLNETMEVRQHLAKGDAPLYHQRRPMRQEARQMEERIASAVDQALQTPPQHLKEEDIEKLKSLNEQLKASLELEDVPEHDQEKVERLQQIQQLLMPPQQQQQDQQEQEEQDQQDQHNQQQQDAQQNESQDAQQQEQQASQQTSSQEAQQQEAQENPSEELSEEEKAAAMERAKEAEEELKEALKNQELKAILKEAEDRTEALEKAKREYKIRQHSKRNLKDW